MDTIHWVFQKFITINTPSEQVMKRIGMNFLSEFEYPNVSQDSILKKHVIYICEK